MTPVSFAQIRLDETAPVHTNHALTLPGTSPASSGFGFPLADLELNVSWTVTGGRREESFTAPPGWCLVHAPADSR